jgi:hypothetical protein
MSRIFEFLTPAFPIPMSLSVLVTGLAVAGCGSNVPGPAALDTTPITLSSASLSGNFGGRGWKAKSAVAYVTTSPTGEQLLSLRFGDFNSPMECGVDDEAEIYLSVTAPAKVREWQQDFRKLRQPPDAPLAIRFVRLDAPEGSSHLAELSALRIDSIEADSVSGSLYALSTADRDVKNEVGGTFVAKRCNESGRGNSRPNSAPQPSTPGESTDREEKSDSASETERHNPAALGRLKGTWQGTGDLPRSPTETMNASAPMKVLIDTRGAHPAVTISITVLHSGTKATIASAAGIAHTDGLIRGSRCLGDGRLEQNQIIGSYSLAANRVDFKAHKPDCSESEVELTVSELAPGFLGVSGRAQRSGAIRVSDSYPFSSSSLKRAPKDKQNEK